MTAVTRASVKSMFQSGDRPSEQDFIDFIDSCAFLVDNNDVTVSASSMNLTGNLTLAGTLSASSAWFGGRVRAFDDLHVSGSVFVSGNVSVSGNAQIGGQLAAMNASVRSVYDLGVTSLSTEQAFRFGPWSAPLRVFDLYFDNCAGSAAITNIGFNVYIGTSAGLVTDGYSGTFIRVNVTAVSLSNSIILNAFASAGNTMAGGRLSIIQKSSAVPIYSFSAMHVGGIEAHLVGGFVSARATMNHMKIEITTTANHFATGSFRLIGSLL